MTALAYVKQESGEPGGAVGRGKSTYKGDKPDEPWGSRLRIGSVNVGTLARRSGEVVKMVERRKLEKVQVC